MREEAKEKLRCVVEIMAVSPFVADYVREDNKEERAEEGLGIAVSNWAEWDGLKIMRVFFSALEDANFHKEAALVQGWIEGRVQP